MKEKRSVTVLTDISLITCIVGQDNADRITKAAIDAGVQGATVHYARGTGLRERLGILGFAAEVEKEVINIVVPSDQANRIFEIMYLAGELDKPGRGFMYITELDKAATFIPPRIREKLAREDESEKNLYQM